MFISLDIDKEKLRLFLNAELFNDTVFDEETRVEIVSKMEFTQDDLYILTILADDDSKEIRKLIAQNEHTPPETLESLSFDDSDEVREALVKNVNLSEDLLEDLCDDDSQNVSEAASLRMEA